MNCLLAASPTLTLRTYTFCTALSLFKVIIHTSLGASIHSFKDYHVTPAVNKTLTGSAGSGSSSGTTDNAGDSESGADTVARMWTILGIVLCVSILVYLSYVARKAVDEELDEEPIRGRSPHVDAEDEDEETVAFLSPRGMRGGDLELGFGPEDDDDNDDRHHQPMVESPFRSNQPLPLVAAASTSSPSTLQSTNSSSNRFWHG